ncbi:putative F-box protein At1g47790 [Lycium barbarum]|uniref:putative F-box protein At1g47790 n=1 Tax=Lycium barbarum TaxID=112863 RepID=UPI00293EE9C1|nr:putative F-box protein At1g47790 [Lycium barbarum]
MMDGITKQLHKDVLIYIVLRFPLRSLMRFKCISRTWYIFLQFPTFINLHLNRSTTSRNEYILLKYSIKSEVDQYKNVLSFLSSNDYDDLNPVSPDIDLPYLTSYRSLSHQLIGPCRGLIALTDLEDIVLSNPSTRKYRLLPHPRCTIDPGQELTEIWIMKEYGINETWIQKYTIKPLPIESSLAIWNDHLLLLQRISGNFSSYDLISDEVKVFNFRGCPSTMRLLVFKESLTTIPRESKHGTKIRTF